MPWSASTIPLACIPLKAKECEMMDAKILVCNDKHSLELPFVGTI
jgi:hypothetical protein